MSRIFAMGDLHLSFAPGIEKPMNEFGSVWEDHYKKVKDDWDARITDDDYVILAGDISWALKLSDAMYDLEWIHERPGKKIIFKGNHDLWWHGITKLNTLFDDIHFMQNDAVLAGDTVIFGTRGWICQGDSEGSKEDIKIYNREVERLKLSYSKALKLSGKRTIGVLHYPPTNPQFEDSGFTKIFEHSGADTVIYGHLHGLHAYKKGFKGIRNGVNYRLVSYDYLNAKFAQL